MFPRPEEEPTPSLRPRALLLIGVALAGFAYRSLAVWQPGGQGLGPLEGWLFAPSETSPQVVLCLVACLLLALRRELRGAFGASRVSPLWAAPPLAAALLLYLWSRRVDAPDLMLASLPVLALGAALLVSGGALARVVALPAGILLFAMPLPGVVTNQLVHPLQLWTAGLTGWLLDTVGMAVVVEGDVVHLADGSFEVIETCSGLRSLQILTILALGWTAFFRLRPLHGLILVAAAPLLAFAANAARVVTLVLNPASDVLAVHVGQGLAVFLSGIIGLYLLDAALLRVLPRPAVGDAAPCTARAPSVAATRGIRRRATALAVLLAALAVASIPAPRAGVPGPRPSVELPGEVDGWKSREERPDSLFLGSVGFSRRSSRRYERGGESVLVFVGHDDLERRSFSLLSPKNALPGRGWHVEERFALALGGRDVPVQALVARSGTRRILSVHAYQGTRGVLGESFRALLALDRSPLRRTGGIRVFRLSTSIGRGPEGRAAAEERLGLLFDRLEPWLLTGDPLGVNVSDRDPAQRRTLQDLWRS